MDENWTYPHDLGNLHIYLVGGIPTPLKNMKVSWDDDIPNIWKNKSHVPNHQPDECSRNKFKSCCKYKNNRHLGKPAFWFWSKKALLNYWWNHLKAYFCLWNPESADFWLLNHLKPIAQWQFQDPKMEVPTIYKAYLSGLCKGISP